MGLKCDLPMNDDLDNIIRGNTSGKPDRTPVKKWAKVRLWLGYIYLLLLLVISHPMMPFLYIGIYVITFGIIIRLAAASALIKDDQLCTSGIYALTRNPLYLGSAVIGLGFAFLSASRWAFVYYFIVLVPAYLRMIRLEEDYLSKLHPDEFRKYKFEVPAFFPMKLSWTDVTGKIDTYRIIRSREHISTAMFVLFIILILFIHRTWLL